MSHLRDCEGSDNQPVRDSSGRGLPNALIWIGAICGFPFVWGWLWSIGLGIFLASHVAILVGGFMIPTKTRLVLMATALLFIWSPWLVFEIAKLVGLAT